jgi:hypothetical protein
VDWQRGLRRQFGREQAFDLEDLSSEPFFSEFRVSNPVSKSSYRVAIRGRGPGGNFCSCPDYATSELGTCKHIEHKHIEFTLARLGKSVARRRRLHAATTLHFTSCICAMTANAVCIFVPERIARRR